MSTFQSVLVPTTPTSATLFTATPGANTASSVITVGYRTIVGVTMGSATDTNTSGLHIKFGNVTKSPTAAATDWFIPAGTVQFFDMGEEFDRLSIFTVAASTTYYVYTFSRT